MKKALLLFLCFLFAFTEGNSQDLILHEVMSDNNSIIQDEEGDYSDWIEIYNASESSINLSNYFLSDNDENLTKWQFPNILLESETLLLVFASGKDLMSPLHTNFKIGKEGEALFLSDSSGIVHQLNATCIPEDQSVIWSYEVDQFYYSENPTPNSMNVEEFLISTSDQLTVSQEGGFYNSAPTIELASQNNLSIYYSLNGGEPSLNSSVFTDPLIMDKRPTTAYDITFIPTSQDWETPIATLAKSPTLRAQTYYYNCPVSEPLGETYFIGDEYIPSSDAIVYSFQTDKKGFFSDSIGIYVEGLFDNYYGRGEYWTRKGHLEVFETSGTKVISQQVNTKNRGASSRFKPQKSLRFLAKKKYGQGQFDYPFYENREFESYKKLNLRPAFADFTQSIFADALSSALVRDLNVDYQESKLSLLYINGEYWGIHDTRENFDEHYLEQHYSIEEDGLTILKNNAVVVEGSNLEYLQMVDYIQTQDMSLDENYNHVAQLMDIDNYIDYNISHMYMGNWDWPHNNVEIWNTDADTTKFRWFFFDCDACFYKEAVASMGLFKDADTNDWDKVILSNLFENESFRSKFTLRFYTLINGPFSPRNVISKIDSLEQLYAPLMPDQILRWNRPETIQNWLSAVDEMRSFAIYRPTLLLQTIQNQFGNPLKLFPNPVEESLFFNVPIGNEDFSYEIFDSTGNYVTVNQTYTDSGIYVGNLASGIYTIQLKIAGVNYSDRFIKL